MFWQAISKNRGDISAVGWAVALCWLVVWGNYVLIDLGLSVYYLVPLDLFAGPLVVTGAFTLLARLARRR